MLIFSTSDILIDTFGKLYERYKYFSGSALIILWKFSEVAYWLMFSTRNDFKFAGYNFKGIDKLLLAC